MVPQHHQHQRSNCLAVSLAVILTLHGLLAMNPPHLSGNARDLPTIWRWPISHVELQRSWPTIACPGCPTARSRASRPSLMQMASGTVPIPVTTARFGMTTQWSSGKAFLFPFQPSSTHLLTFANFRKEEGSTLLQMGRAKLVKPDCTPLFIRLIRSVKMTSNHRILL